jgi:hypothetical protein
MDCYGEVPIRATRAVTKHSQTLHHGVTDERVCSRLTSKRKLSGAVESRVELIGTLKNFSFGEGGSSQTQIHGVRRFFPLYALPKVSVQPQSN